MAIEIERKYLVVTNAWRHNAIGTSYCQGYLSGNSETTVRVRTEGSNAFLTIKGRKQGISRPEFEYPIPFKEAQELQSLCRKPLVKKTRYHLLHDGMTWEVDEFHGENAGLIIAEIELDDPEATFALPPWVGQEISHDPRYFNSNLSVYPFSKWS